MTIYLYNTLSQKREPFSPINCNNVRLYVCGPTVYDHPHIGNARAIVVYDALYRLLKIKFGSQHITYVRNITDVDDKINIRASELGTTIQQLTSQTITNFHDDMNYLGCDSPNIEPKATEHIAEMIEIIEILSAKNHAYEKDGVVYFNVASYPDYNKLSGRNFDDMLSGTRVEVDSSKKNIHDFVLWKPVSAKDDPSSIFESPWGLGRPGWHIECSAMSRKYLGETFDIHCGGADLIFPHHTNEIAQSCCAFPGSEFAKYWVHNGFLSVNGEKMSKSLGNFITVRDLMNKDVPGEVIRWLLLSTHYRKPLNFTDQLLHQAQENLDYLYRAISNMGQIDDIHGKDLYDEEFIGFLANDLNTPAAFSYLLDLAKKINVSQGSDKKLLQNKLLNCAQFMGLLNADPQKWFQSGGDAEYIERLIKEREQAKKQKNWDIADSIRSKLLAMGVILEDMPDGQTSWRRKN